MKWLKQKIRSWLREDDRELVIGPTPAPRPGPDIDGLRFTVMPAHGGCIIQTAKYDNKKDTTNYETYIVTDFEDIATKVGEIVVLELYRR